MKHTSLRALPAKTPPKHLFSFDYDGTLRDSKSSPPLSEEFFRFIRTHRDRYGIRWGINTGRDIDYLMDEYAAFAPYAPDFIITCERYIYTAKADECLAENTPANELCRKTHEKIFKKYHTPIEALFARMKNDFPHCSWIRSANDPHAIEETNGGVLDHLMPLIEDFLRTAPELSFQRADPYLRFCHAAINKGSTLLQVARQFSAKPHCVFIIGDGHNDLDAFRAFPTALLACPSNAHADVAAYISAHGGYISPHREHQAVLDTLHNIVLPTMGKE